MSCYAQSMISFIRHVNLSDFAFLLGCRVGEASHPGPPEHESQGFTTFAICNPTALLGKVGSLHQFPADVICCSETSVTPLASQMISKDALGYGMKCFFSQFVKAKLCNISDKPSLRGSAAGAAILSKIPSRSFRYTPEPELWETCRVAFSVIRIASLEVLVIAIYGFVHERPAENIRLNDLLLAHVSKIALDCGMPYVIAGDFNCRPTSLPAFRVLSRAGVQEAFSFAEAKFGITLPATCKHVTRHDSCILHPFLSQAVVHMHVDHELAFEPHSPLFVTFNFSINPRHSLRWHVPKSWSSLGIESSNLEQSYDHFSKDFKLPQQTVTVEEGSQLLQQWSQTVERAVDRSIRIQHKLDPIKFPLHDLPPSHKGRCRPHKPKNVVQSKPMACDRFGGYNPPDEVFRINNLHKVRQCRRLRALMKAYSKCLEVDNEAAPYPAQRFRTRLFPEWLAILRAKGYGREWCRWMLSFEAIAFVPTDLPSLEELQTFTDITVVDCDAACKQEAINRAKSSKYLLELDVKDGFLSTTYKMVKAKPTPKLDEVPLIFQAKASLCRIAHGQPISLRLQNSCQFLTQQSASFGDAKVFIISQSDSIVYIRVLDGVLPTHGDLRQERVSTSPQEVFQEFSRFWTPFWCRDTVDSQDDSAEWADLLEFIDSINLPTFQVNVILDDAKVWQQTIARLKPYKAEGVCGWRYSELQMLPFDAVMHLWQIFSLIWNVGLSEAMMVGRTVLLAKNDCPRSINDGRPITILSCLYRLASKVVFDQVVQQWASQLPDTISGGLPSKGVRDLAFTQSFAIETAVTAQKPLLGACIDLVKAFNLIPRLPVRAILRRLGIEEHVLRFWHRCLLRLSRVPVIAGIMGDPIYSTTGLPEGDCWSVLGMLGLSTIFYYALVTPKLTPCCYADNWSWFTSDERCNILAWQSLLTFVQLLRMTIDFSKSWVWGSTPSTRASLANINLLFPDGGIKLEVKYAVRDLGEIIQYSFKKFSRPVLERFAECTKRLGRLEWIAIPQAEKAKVVMSGILSHGLYGVELHYLASHNFTSLRRAVCRVFAGKHKHSASMLACSLLSRKIVDPGFFVLQAIVRLLLRMVHLRPAVFLNVLSFAIHHARTTPCGPVSSIVKYLADAGWSLESNGHCVHVDGFVIDLRNDNCKKAMFTLQAAWFSYVHEHVMHRHGIPETLPDFWTTRQCILKLEPSQQKLLSLNVVGGWQSEVIKAKWNAQSDVACPLCGAPDLQHHRFLECPSLQLIRDKHPDACSILTNRRGNWVFHPIAQLPVNHELYISCLQALTYTPEVEFIDNLPPYPRFFTDGACELPTLSQYRRAAWAVVADLSTSEKQRAELLFECAPTRTVPHLFQCAMVGLTEGQQCIARSELFAVLKACQITVHHSHTLGAVIYTDSQYVLNVVYFLRRGLHMPWHRLANGDLVKLLAEVLELRDFTFVKVKSHRDPASASDTEDLWTILGNQLADKAAGLTLQHVPQHFLDLRDEVVGEYTREKQWLQCVFQYFLDLNIARAELISKAPSQQRQAQCVIADFQALKIQDFSHVSYVHIPAISVELAGCNLQGANLALYILAWARTLQWPQEDQATPQQKLGVTWMELLFNFYITTGQLPPVRVSGHAVQSKYFPYHSLESKSLMPSRRTVSAMCLVFQNCIKAVETLCKTKLWDKSSKQGAGVLKLAGFFGEAAGIPLRPVMTMIDQTVDETLNYLQSIGESGALNLPIPCFNYMPTVSIDSIVEPDAATRYRSWNRLKNEECSNL